MSKAFIEGHFNQLQLTEAISQEKQLAYFTESKIQPDYQSQEYLQQWASRKFETSDYFLNYVKSVFKSANFLTFFKYLRFPLPSAKIINNKIIPDLQRVFEAEDSCFDYDVQNVSNSDFLAELESQEFNQMIFEGLLHEHNSILITDLKADKANSPYRMLVPIKNVVSIKTHGHEIEKIAIKANWTDENGFSVPGYYYIDERSYIFYTEDYQERSRFDHGLEDCPAHFIAARGFGSKQIVRESIFSYIREELEEYNFLKTLQKMTEPNGAIPIATHLKSKDKNKSEDFKSVDNEPGGSEAMASGRAKVEGTTIPSEGILQTGTIIAVPRIEKTDGSLDMDAVQNFIKFHYIPTESLIYLRDRIASIERSIITTIVGDATDSNESAKNEMQIRKSVIVLENTLRRLSGDLSRIRKLADTDFLGLKYGIDRVNEVTTFYGTDFFLESEDDLFADFKTAPNPIERKNILIRLAENKYRNNAEKLNRQIILNNLLPFISDLDFDRAVAKGIDPIVFDLQNRFSYWVQQFESEYGNITSFFAGMGDISEAEKYRVINDLIINLIPKQNVDSSIASIRADGTDSGLEL
jgi:hypothetical protein